MDVFQADLVSPKSVLFWINKSVRLFFILRFNQELWRFSKMRWFLYLQLVFYLALVLGDLSDNGKDGKN